MKILNLGSCNIDYVYHVEHIVRPGETVAIHSMEQFPGGKGLNQSIALARAGAKVYHAGCIGQEGLFLKELMAACGVDVSFVRVEEGRNGHAIIQVDSSGQNSIVIFPGTNHKITPAYVEELLDQFSAGDLLLLQNEISALPYILQKATQRGLKILWNPSPFSQELKNIDLHCISILILNEVEAAEFSGKIQPEDCLQYFGQNYPELTVVLTLGERGCLFYQNQKTLFQPAFYVKAVDTTAAGDTFTGYWTASMAQGEEAAQALRLAAAASALAVTRKGAASSIPLRHEVLAALPTLPLRTEENDVLRQKEVVLRYFDAHITQANIEDLARELGYTPGYTHSWLKKNMGMPFSQLLQQRRCREAARLLTQSDLPAGEIIRRVGYQNESFFRKLFSDSYGISMREYRKKYQC